MKNFTLFRFFTASISSHLPFKKMSFTFVKFFLLCVLPGSSLLFFPFSSRSQSFTNNTTTLSGEQLTPGLEKTVRNTLKQSSLKLQLIENNGQLGLPENVVAYFSSGNQTVFIEKNRL